MYKRKTVTIVLFFAALIIVLVACGNREEPGISEIDWDDHDVRAEQFVKALLNGDFTIAAEGFNDEMDRAVGVIGLRRAWNNTVRLAGEYKYIEKTEIVPDDDYDIYNVVTNHNRRNINSRIVFTHDGLITGLFFSFE